MSYEKLGGISARAMMWYPVHQKPDHPFAPFEVCEIKGGIGSFMSQLATQLVNTELRLCTAVSALRQDGQRFTLLTTAGETQPFDAVVLALGGPLSDEQRQELLRVAETVRLSRRTHAVLWQNITLALGIKSVFLVMAVFGTATMWMAVFADMGASLLVIGNGLRLLRLRTRR